MRRRIDRFDKYMEYKGLNDNQVTLALGLSVGTIGKSRKENRDLSNSVVDKILNFYTDINPEWLMYNEGEMLVQPDGMTAVSQIRNKSAERGHDVSDFANFVPILPLFAQGGSLDEFVVSVKDSDCEKIISPVKADFAITVAGESMAPEYPSGSQILIKKVNEKAFLEWGKVYVLDTCNGTVIKELRKGEIDGEVLCVSLNPDPKYIPFTVKFEDIYGVYRVIMCMSLK